MIIRKFVLIGLFSIVISVLFPKCSVTSTKAKNPTFVRDISTISRDINSVILTEEINLHGIETSSNGATSSELAISLINPDSISTESSTNNKALEEIAILVKYALKDTNAYTSYQVLFIHRKAEGTLTTSNSEGQIFKSAELKPYFHDVTLGERFDSVRFRAFGKTNFTKSDSEIVLAIKYYDHIPNSPLLVKMFKQTDNGEILLTARDLGKLEPGYNYSYTKLKVDEFYKEQDLNSGFYRVEYLVRDSIVGTKLFRLL